MVFDNNDIFVKRNDLILRTIHDSYFVIDITDNYMDDKCVLYEINEVGAFIWERINGNNNVTVIVQDLFDAIVDDIDIQNIYSDTILFISELLQNGLIERA